MSNKPAISWANRTKTATAAVPLTKTNKDRGTRSNGIVESFTPKSYKTGSFGVEIKYTTDGHDRPVYENIVLSTLSQDGVLTPTKWGESSLKRRLQAFGLTSEEINSFPIPKTPKDAGNDAYVFSGIPVVLYLKDEEYMGRPKKVVGSVFAPN